jgi:hypothetical protein
MMSGEGGPFLDDLDYRSTPPDAAGREGAGESQARRQAEPVGDPKEWRILNYGKQRRHGFKTVYLGNLRNVAFGKSL